MNAIKKKNRQKGIYIFIFGFVISQSIAENSSLKELQKINKFHFVILLQDFRFYLYRWFFMPSRFNVFLFL